MKNKIIIFLTFPLKVRYNKDNYLHLEKIKVNKDKTKIDKKENKIKVNLLHLILIHLKIKVS